ncbi:MAG TPA: hypothetical protein PLL30_00370 [Candidatus Krumholzibacteria bacterium]|nr:hypothetical protein [Candidatus Krumholzibacteria bacterium]HPD70213.1 hypothetical protein [Candidatus Krumholzibacteria bacterium]HRY40087.1 hypothetical protein [Candidatus Krumholzibacteria bacterium]
MESRPVRAPRSGSPGDPTGTPAGGFVHLDGEVFYRISASHRLEPFLVSLASDSDLWMFVTSGGGLTAGRVDADGALFPYRTVDQLHDAHHETGPLTLIRIADPHGEPILWEPFGEASGEDPAVERNLYKNAAGNRLVFEAIDHRHGLIFRYRWAACDEFGWVRTATLENRGAALVRVDVLDGLRNILPFGAPLSLYQQASTLVDAYKSAEVDPATGLGIFSLTTGITDRAEALEVLRANTVWCCGLEDFRVHLSGAVVAAFRHGRVLSGERILNGRRGNYLVSSTLDLAPGHGATWHLVADSRRDHVQIAALRRRLQGGEDLAGRIEACLASASDALRRIVASADGLQLCGRAESWSHHLANVLFNTMRGGVFAQNHDVPSADFADFLGVRNRAVLARQRERIAGWPASRPVQALRAEACATGDADFARLSHEYLPLFFGRRHGDPSRPWNRFAIRVRDRHGQRALHYEGNWRDIFQNWEALATAFPAFLPSLVAKFVNASTVDGFNPYRITRDGVDWETPAVGDPWSNLGYWGDHQIIYLLKLLESLDRHDPAAIEAMLAVQIFSYAEVPYRLKPYADLLRDPRATIEFDTARAARIAERVARVGADGKLLAGGDGSVYHANLFEKLLVPALSKLSNLIPDAGIWMNTQRPEWNDANNALGGGGVSVVTLCYLRRYLAFLAGRFGDAAGARLPVSAEVTDWFERVFAILAGEQRLLAADRLGGRDRKRLMDALGEAFSTYRQAVYARGFSGRRTLARRQAAEFCRTALRWVDRSIVANRREDGLYHTYNLLEFADDGAAVTVAHLPEMLEGQVAVLSSGALAPDDGLAILERLFASALYRSDQRSFLLYPAHERPGFLARNVVTEADVRAIPLLWDLAAAGDASLLARDAEGIYRFRGDVQSARDVAATLDDLALQTEWSAAVARDRTAVLDLFERVFRHRSYTGRSGAMYAYEGIGCIYWHMVAKLLLAAQENVLRAEREGRPATVRRGLARMYVRIRAGLGYRKTVAEYGAFPTDPYSHTPAVGGAKQPGMTGQVKEEILTRLGELGVRVEGGAVRFQPVLLEAGEFLPAPADFPYVDVEGQPRTIALGEGSLAFTLCQVPVVYERMDGTARIAIAFTDGSTREEPGAALPVDLAAEVFARSGRIASLRVAVPAGVLH